jgi:hypothetical protein
MAKVLGCVVALGWTQPWLALTLTHPTKCVMTGQDLSLASLPGPDQVSPACPSGVSVALPSLPLSLIFLSFLLSLPLCSFILPFKFSTFTEHQCLHHSRNRG